MTKSHTLAGSDSCESVMCLRLALRAFVLGQFFARAAIKNGAMRQGVPWEAHVLEMQTHLGAWGVVPLPLDFCEATQLGGARQWARTHIAWNIFFSDPQASCR
jgi:hypothetical protein